MQNKLRPVPFMHTKSLLCTTNTRKFTHKKRDSYNVHTIGTSKTKSKKPPVILVDSNKTYFLYQEIKLL